MKRVILVIFSLALLSLVLSGCSNHRFAEAKGGKKIELTVSAAASLQDALNEIKTTFEKEHPNVKINYNFGASGALEQQISQGAPVDLFFSAAEDKFGKVVNDGLIDKKNGTNLLKNDLVLVVPRGSSKGIEGFKTLIRAKKIAIGTPESVPAGQYAVETLKNLKIWDAVKDKLIYAKDVRQVLTYVETGNVDAGIVYKTDAQQSKNVKIVATAGDNTHDPIIYPVGVVKGNSHLKEARIFYDYLQNEPSMNTFKKYGFSELN